MKLLKKAPCLLSINIAHTLFALTILAGMATFFIVPKAEAANVTSFNASPTSIRSRQISGFTWTIDGASGYYFVLPCSMGISYKKTDGAEILCDTKNTIDGNVSSNALDVAITNTSGTIKTVFAQIIPIDPSLGEQTSNVKTVGVTVAPLDEVITTLESTSTGSTTLQTNTKIVWVAEDVPGVNITIQCNKDVRISSPIYTKGLYLPCGDYIFSALQPKSSSMELYFQNPSPDKTQVRLTVTPGFDNNIYDGTHSKSIILEIPSDQLRDPSSEKFTVSPVKIESGGTATFNWVAQNAFGANLIFRCQQGLSISVSTSSTPFSCGDLALATSTKGSVLSFTFKNSADRTQFVSAELILARYDQSYINTRLQADFQVLANGVKLSADDIAYLSRISGLGQNTLNASGTAILNSIGTGQSLTGTSAGLNVVAGSTGSLAGAGTGAGSLSGSVPGFSMTYPINPSLRILGKINQIMVRGSSGSQVTLLQRMLSLDKAIYPEQSVTGTFGPATERAVKRFQHYTNIAHKGDLGYGVVGLKTRAKLNETYGR